MTIMTNNRKIVIIKEMSLFQVPTLHQSQIIIMTNKKILLEISHAVEEKCKPSPRLLKLGNFHMLITSFGKIMAIPFKKRRAAKVSITNVQTVTR